MKRKVIKQGNGTLTITLPKEWATKVGLKGGDDIDVNEIENGLKISSEKHPAKYSLNLNLNKISVKNSRTHISNAYKLGFDEIHVVFSNPSDLVPVQETVDKLIGFEVTSNTKESCLIKDIALTNKEEFHSVFKKAYQLNLVLFEMLKEDMEKEDYSNLNIISQYQSKLISFTDYCRRIINKHTVFNDKLDKSLYIISLKMNYTGTVLKEIYQYLTNSKGKLDKDTISLLSRAEEMYRTVFEGYFKEDISEVDKGISMKKKLYDNEGCSVLEKSKGKNSVVIAKTLEMIKHIYGSTGPIVAILYQNSINKGNL